MNMKIALSTHLYAYNVLSEDILSEIASFGFKNIEVWAGNPHFDYGNIASVKVFSRLMKKYDLNPISFHGPIYMNVADARKKEWLSLADTNEERRKTAEKEFKKTIAAMELLGSNLIVAHIGNTGDPFTETSLNAFFKSLDVLLAAVQKNGINIALENIVSELSSYDIIESVLKRFNNQNLVVCLDVGHSKIAGGISNGIERFGGKILSLHIHDNNGIKDEHLVPGTGIINWQKIRHRLSSYKENFVLELRDLGNIPEILLETKSFLKGYLSHGH